MVYAIAAFVVVAIVAGWFEERRGNVHGRKIGMVTLLLLPLNQACAYAEPSETIRVESGKYGFTDDEMAKMTTEADRLCELTEGVYCPVLTRDDAPNVAMKTSIGIGDALGMTSLAQTLLTASFAISIKPGLNEHDFRLVWMHELGHAGGCMDHISIRNVMTAEIKNGTDDWTESDLDCIDGTY